MECSTSIVEKRSDDGIFRHYEVRKIIKRRGHFPNDDAAIKLIWLAIRNINDGKVRSARDWKEAMGQFAILYGDRFINPVV